MNCRFLNGVLEILQTKEYDERFHISMTSMKDCLMQLQAKATASLHQKFALLKPVVDSERAQKLAAIFGNMDELQLGKAVAK